MNYQDKWRILLSYKGNRERKLKATELKENLFPRREVVKAYEAVDQNYERTVQDRGYEIWYPLVTADPVKDQKIEQRISQLYRVKDQLLSR